MFDPTTDERFRETADAIFHSATEADEADALRAQGVRVIKHRGRFWRELRRGFYQPVHILSQFKADELSRPTPLCWGYRAAVDPADSGFANGAVSAYVLDDFEDYPARWNGKRRADLRKCRQRTRIVEVRSLDFLREHGYEIVVSQLNRSKHRNIPTRDEFVQSVKESKSALWLAGFVPDGAGGWKLCGFTVNHAVDGVAYAQDLYATDEGLAARLVYGMYAELVEICHRSGCRLVVNGQHTPENPTLSKFKLQMGFRMEQFPARVSMLAPASGLLRRINPHIHFRLTGKQ